jgi:hypothetical protein
MRKLRFNSLPLSTGIRYQNLTDVAAAADASGKCRRPLARVGLLIISTGLVMSLCAAWSQPKATPIPFKPEDPELYFAFFQYHGTLDQNIQAGNAAAAAQLTNNAVALYHVTTPDFGKLTTEVRAFIADFASWQAPVQAYYAKLHASKQLPDMNTIKAFQFQRQTLVKARYDSIHQTLSSASWNGLYTYINGDFKRGLRP